MYMVLSEEFLKAEYVVIDIGLFFLFLHKEPRLWVLIRSFLWREKIIPVLSSNNPP